MALEKIERPKKINIADRLQPKTIEGLIRKYDLENEKIYDFFDYLVDYINKKLE